MTRRRADSGVRRTTDVRAAAQALAGGSLVGLPTETVYGLAADARNPGAVRRVFDVKARPPGHPLIVHLAAIADVDAWVARVPAAAAQLMAEHWPGPMTLVLPKAPEVSTAITGGQDTIAVRVPGGELARAVVAELAQITGRPAGVVAPSANRFGAVSPTTADHVLDGLGEYLSDGDLVLDGGTCDVGVESTIIDATGDGLRILRPGAITLPGDAGAAQLRPALDARDDAASARGPDARGAAAPRVPGSLWSHYAPTARVVLLPPGEDPLAALTAQQAAGTMGTGNRAGLLAPVEVATPLGWVRLASPADDRQYARELYGALRRADDEDLDLVIAIPPGGGPLAAAITDRLARAAF